MRVPKTLTGNPSRRCAKCNGSCVRVLAAESSTVQTGPSRDVAARPKKPTARPAQARCRWDVCVLTNPYLLGFAFQMKLGVSSSASCCARSAPSFHYFTIATPGAEPAWSKLEVRSKHVIIGQACQASVILLSAQPASIQELEADRIGGDPCKGLEAGARLQLAAC